MAKKFSSNLSGGLKSGKKVNHKAVAQKHIQVPSRGKVKTGG